jgi:uncharacterized protein (DUF58 family)
MALFDADFMQKLEYLTLISRKLYKGRARGEHQTFRRGSSLEFHDYRPYQPGDDFRYIDWSIYSRLDRLFVKLFAAEEDLEVQVLLDTSASMGFGTPSKMDYSRRVAAALSYIALLNLDRVGAAAFSASVGPTLPPFRRRGVNSLFSFYEGLQAGGTTRFNESLKSFSAKSGRPGLAIVISDLMDPAGYQEGIRSLVYGRYDIMLIHVLSEEEIDPTLRGPFELTDVETSARMRVSIEQSMIEAYQERLRAYFEEIEGFCLSNAIEYVRSSTLVPFEDLVLKYLRQGMYLH